MTVILIIFNNKTIANDLTHRPFIKEEEVPCEPKLVGNNKTIADVII